MQRHEAMLVRMAFRLPSPEPSHFPGLYVLGLAYQHWRSFHFIGGVGRDAELLARTIVARSSRRSQGVAGPTAERLLAPFPSGPRTAIVNAP